MAYSELVSFIRQQMGLGKDARSIRAYLVGRNMDPAEIDRAFDEVFSPNKAMQFASQDSKHPEKLLMVGIVALVLVFAGVGVGIYYKLLPENEATLIVEQPIPEPETPDVTEQQMLEPEIPDEPVEQPQSQNSSSSICDFEDSEEKYQCYLVKFENDEVQCYKIADLDEREFCYIAQDLYVLSS